MQVFQLILNWNCFYFGFITLVKLLKGLNGLIWWILLLKFLFETTCFVSNVSEWFNRRDLDMPCFVFGIVCSCGCFEMWMKWLKLICESTLSSGLTFLWNEDSYVCYTHVSMAWHLSNWQMFLSIVNRHLSDWMNEWLVIPMYSHICWLFQLCIFPTLYLKVNDW